MRAFDIRGTWLLLTFSDCRVDPLRGEDFAGQSCKGNGAGEEGGDHACKESESEKSESHTRGGVTGVDIG